MDKEIFLTGYWNGDQENWTLTKDSTSDKDIIVVISVEPVEIPVKNPLKDLEKSVKKVSKELRGFVRDLKKIK